MRTTLRLAGFGTVLVTAAPLQGAIDFAVQPQHQVVTNCRSFCLFARATGGGPLSYQWFREGTAIARATNNFLCIAEASSYWAGNYSCRATDGADTADSQLAQITIQPDTDAPRLLNAWALLGSSPSEPIWTVYVRYSEPVNIVGGELEYQFAIISADPPSESIPPGIVETCGSSGAFYLGAPLDPSRRYTLAVLSTENTFVDACAGNKPANTNRVEIAFQSRESAQPRLALTRHATGAVVFSWTDGSFALERSRDLRSWHPAPGSFQSAPGFYVTSGEDGSWFFRLRACL